MTKNETTAIMAVLKAAYPQYYQNMSREDAFAVIDLWAEMFADDDFDLMKAAVKHYIATDSKQYRPPHIGAIKESLARIQEPEEMSEQEAWNCVSHALHNGIYGSKEEFEKLPPQVKRLVGSANQLREWAVIDEEELQTVIASNFQRSYRTRVKSDRDYQKLPKSVRDVVGVIAGKMDMALLMNGEK